MIKVHSNKLRQVIEEVVVSKQPTTFLKYAEGCFISKYLLKDMPCMDAFWIELLIPRSLQTFWPRTVVMRPVPRNQICTKAEQ